MTASRLNPDALLADLADQVRAVERDLADQLDSGELRTELAELRATHQSAKTAQRTAANFDTWRAGEVTQSAVAWVLGTVFVRWSEDNELIAPVLSGPADRMGEAQDAQSAYFRVHTDHTNGHWLRACFETLRRSDVGAMLFDPAHNPAYRLPISHDSARALIAFWRTRRADGELVHDFRDKSWDTRFLGDLYQDLSQRAKDQYALLQTPKFVEKFILKYTLKPALDEFGHDGLRVIDPTCGSGHFLLGAFEQLVEAWRTDTRLNNTEVARRALDSVHGVDLNPFAVAIARFRLMLAAWKVAGITTIEQAASQRWAVTVATGDSLLANRRESFEGMDAEAGLQLAAEDTHEFPTLLDIGSYHVVVGNPPYITVKDAALNREYRRYYTACHRQYQLTVPFAQRFFELARPAEEDGRGAGYVGQITSNAFMKREFGTKLIKDFFPKVDLTHVIDMSGIQVPGHGTPTVILFGRERRSNPEGTVRAVLGIRGDTSKLSDPSEGDVWRAIESQVDSPGSESDWISVVDLPRSRLASHPWSLSGGGANQLLLFLDSVADARLSELVELIGFLALTREDDAYVLPPSAARRLRLADTSQTFAIGAELRDWIHSANFSVVFPYVQSGEQSRLSEPARRYLWSNRVLLLRRRALSGYHIDRGIDWFVYSDFHPNRWAAERLIAFAFVATHNHFVLDRGGKVFKQSAPVIKLREVASEDDYLRLLGVLNSSTACFWLRQVSQPKGGSGIGRGVQDENWEDRYEFTGTKLQQFPLPETLPLDRARRLDDLAQQCAASTPQAVATQALPSRERLAKARAKYLRIQARMIAEQEELDWDVYHQYGLLSESEAAAVVIPDPATVPDLVLGERAFEIILACQMAEGKTDTQWFARHGSTPIIELPEHWPDDYRRVVQARIDLIEKRRDLALIDRPECKRRWSPDDWDWDEQAERAVREWLQDRLEARHLWFADDELGTQQPVSRSVAELADLVRPDHEWGSVAALWAADFLGRPDADTAEIVAALVDDEHVPFLAAYRYKGAGLTNRAAWERVWELQRAEDEIAAELGHEVTHPDVRKAVEANLGTIPVPPKYGSADFARPSYWRHRGKLDVPKERFISYPGASRDGDGSLLLGWAGWDHREQAHALSVTIAHRRTEAGWDTTRLLPLLAGLAEVLPWVRQWHTEIDPAYGTSPAEAYDGFLDTQLADLDLGVGDLRVSPGRVDVSPLPGRRRAPAERRQPREPRAAAGLDPAQRDAVLEFAAGGPITTAQVAELLGVETPKARNVVRQLVDAGELVQSGVRRGACYHLPEPAGTGNDLQRGQTSFVTG